MKTELRVDKNALETAAQRLEGIPNGMNTALMRSFNRALLEGRTAATRAVAKQYTLRAKDVRPSFRMMRASHSDVSASLVSRGTRLPLETFAHRPRTDTTGNKRKEIRVSVRRGALKPLGQAFVHRGQILQRLGSTRLPVQKKFGPAIPSMLEDDQVADVVVETLSKSVDKRLEHETIRMLNKT